MSRTVVELRKRILFDFSKRAIVVPGKVNVGQLDIQIDSAEALRLWRKTTS